MGEFEKVQIELHTRVASRAHERIHRGVDCHSAFDSATLDELARLELRMRALAQAMLEAFAAEDEPYRGHARATLRAIAEGSELP